MSVQYIVIGVVCLAAILVLFDRKKPKNAGGRANNEIRLQPLESADEASPTQSGRFRAMKVKSEIQRARQIGKKEESETAQKSVTDTRSEQLPDPFSVELQDQD